MKLGTLKTFCILVAGCALVAGCDDVEKKRLAAVASNARFMEARVVALEEYVRAQQEKDRVIAIENDMYEREVATVQAEEKKYKDAIASHNKWYKEAVKRYGALVYVGYDTNTSTRVYRRCDGELIRNPAPKEPGKRFPRPVRRNRKRFY